MIRPIALLACLTLAVGPALAANGTQQTPEAKQTPVPPLTIDPGQTHTNTDQTLSGQGKNQVLSNRLAQTNGVIHPPPVDQGMMEKPKQTGTMPVVPPPGTPGGNPHVVPK